MSLQNVNTLIDITKDLLDYFENDTYLNQDDGILNYLKVAKENLASRKYTVSVIAAMKAGKSTTFNALLGRDLLPNENKACTTTITEIKHSEKECEYIEKIYKDNKREKIQSIHDKSIEEIFHNDIREGRKNNHAKHLKKYYLECPIDALREIEHQNLVQNFVLIDTPGPNEADSGDFDVAELQRLALQQLRDSDALIMLLDYQTYKSDTNAWILKNIFEDRTDLSKDKDKIYFIINKIDAMTSKDGCIDDVIQNVRFLIKEHAPFITTPNIYTLSAKQALLARTVLNGKATEEMKNEMKKSYGGKYTDKIIIDGDEYEVVPKPEILAEKLLVESGIKTIENSIISNVFRICGKKMFESGVDKLQKVMDNKKAETQNLIENYEKSGDELYQTVSESKIKIETLRTETESLKIIPLEQLNLLEEQVNALIQAIPDSVNKILTQVLPETTILESDDPSFLQERINAIQREAENSIKIVLNREADKIERLSFNSQNKIGQELNREFYKIVDKATDITGQRMSLNLDIISMNSINAEEIKKESGNIEIEKIREFGTNSDLNANSIAKSIIAFSAVGASVGSAIPVIGTTIGSILGAAVGMIGSILNLKSNSKNVPEKRIYKADITQFKKEVNESAKQISLKIANDIKNSLMILKGMFIESVESQMNFFIKSLQNELDNILSEYEKNKNNVDEFTKHMYEIQTQLSIYENRLATIK